MSENVSTEILFPGIAEVTEAIPVGRRVYIELAGVIADVEKNKNGYVGPRPFAVRHAIHMLAATSVAQELDPPLPEDLAGIIYDMSVAIRAQEQEPTNFTYDPDYGDLITVADRGIRAISDETAYSAAVLAVRAAIDHGMHS